MGLYTLYEILCEAGDLLMRKFLMALLVALCVLGVSCACAETLTFDVIHASCEIDDDYILITPANMSAHPDWLANRGTTLEEQLADFEARGVLAQAWSKEGDQCIEFSAVQDSQAMEYFDIDQQSTSVRTAYRKQHENGAQYKSEGYNYSSAEWKNLSNAGRFLVLKYKRDTGSESYRGFARRTIRNGYTITVDCKVYGRSLKNKDNNTLTEILKTWKFSTVLTKPLDVVNKVVFTETPPTETDTGKFTVEGTCDPGLNFTGVLMRMSSPDPILVQTTATAKGKFSMDVELPEEGVWLMTLTVDNQGVVTEEIVFETTTYQDDLLPVNFDEDMPIDFEIASPSVIPGDTLVISGKTIRNVKIQCLVGDSYDKQVTTNANGTFSFKIDTYNEGDYNITLVFQKKNYTTRRFTAMGNRTLTETDMFNRYKEEAVKPAYSTLTDKIKGYTGRIMGYELFLVSKTQREDGTWLLEMGMRTTKKTASGFRDIVYVTAADEPTFAPGAKWKMYGKCLGEMEVDGKDYPAFELLFWDGEVK